MWDAVKGVIAQQIDVPAGGATQLSGLTFAPSGWIAYGATDGDRRITLTRVPCLCEGGSKRREAAAQEPSIALVHGAHTRQVTDLAMLRGGNVAGAGEEALLLSASADQTCALWDIVQRKRVRRFVGHGRRVNCLAPPPPADRHAASDDGPFSSAFASASADGTVMVWDHRQASAILTLAGHESNVTGVSQFPGGGVLATTGDDGSCRIWDLRFYGSPDGAELLQLRTDMSGLAEGFRSGAPAHNVEVRRGLTGCAWSYSGALVMACSDDTNIYGWEAFAVSSVEGRTPPPIWGLEGHGNRVAAVAPSPNGQAIATADWNGHTKIWC